MQLQVAAYTMIVALTVNHVLTVALLCRHIHTMLFVFICAMAVACVPFQGHRVPMPYWSVKATIYFWRCFTLLGPALHK